MNWLERSALGASALFLSVPLLVALNGPVGSFANPTAACGSAVQDGGITVIDGGGGDGGFTVADGGYAVVPITAESMASIKIENNAAEPVYLGGSTVQPGAGVLAICNAAATCSDTSISIDTRSGALFCTAIAATTVRTLSGGY
jgi:hypothetical protein